MVLSYLALADPGGKLFQLLKGRLRIDVPRPSNQGSSHVIKAQHHPFRFSYLVSSYFSVNSFCLHCCLCVSSKVEMILKSRRQEGES